ncbi:MAG: hypothetical protein GXP03_15335 [Alphaproteobacteria bacterium]|nr:hypothetical protein [Alphaproteobacteria bacterium]
MALRFRLNDRMGCARRIKSLKPLLLALIVLFNPLQFAKAQQIAGQFDPAFETALALWLDDDEETALPALAGLAREGNIAARVLLGMIDKHSALQGPWVSLLPKGERVALLRTDGGLSGTSWLRRVGDVPAVKLWLDILDSKADVAAALAFADMGEARLLRAGLIALEARQHTGFEAFQNDPRYPGELRYLIWREWQKDGETLVLDRALSKLPKGDPQRRIIQQDAPQGRVESWLLATKLAPSLQTLCRAGCADSLPSCLRAGYQTMGGYRRFATLGTPLASLIPEARFAASARGQASVLRRGLLYAFLTEERLQPIAETDACFANLLAQEGQKF